MIVSVTALRFDGKGRLDCRKCGQHTDFPDSARIVIIDLGQRQDVLDASTSDVLHRCDRRYWMACERCGGNEPTIRFDRHGGYGRRTRTRQVTTDECRACGGRIVQMSEPLPLVEVGSSTG